MACLPVLIAWMSLIVTGSRSERNYAVQLDKPGVINPVCWSLRRSRSPAFVVSCRRDPLKGRTMVESSAVLTDSAIEGAAHDAKRLLYESRGWISRRELLRKLSTAGHPEARSRMAIDRLLTRNLIDKRHQPIDPVPEDPDLALDEQIFLRTMTDATPYTIESLLLDLENVQVDRQRAEKQQRQAENESRHDFAAYYQQCAFESFNAASGTEASIRAIPGVDEIETACAVQGEEFTPGGLRRLFAKAAQSRGETVANCLCLKTTEATDYLGALSKDAQTETRKDESKQRQSERLPITVDEANAVAMDLAKQDARFVDDGIRQWAARIQEKAGKKCTEWTVGQTRLWLTTMETTGRGRRKGKRQSRPKAVSLNESAAGKGERDVVLKQLAQEQAADFEPSPLDDDPPDEPLRVRHRKRV
jgi:hypothetical protein